LLQIFAYYSLEHAIDGIEKVGGEQSTIKEPTVDIG
jgi:hypothetical protein